MKTLKRICMLLALGLLAVTVIVPLPAAAANDDFDVDYTITPEIVGYKGADIGIRLRVHNEGTTPITKIRVEVTTMAGYRYDRVRTIAVGTTTPWLLFEVPFGRDDLNIDKLLTVKIENDSDSAWDGTFVRMFQVEGTRDIFRIMKTVTPGGGVYRVGDTVNISYNMENTMAAHAATGMTAEGHMFVDGDHFYASPVDSHGVVMPGEMVTTFFNYTFTEDDVGEVEVICHLSYTMMGKSYSEPYGTWIYFDVLPPREFDFEAVLSAEPTTIDAGDEVTFTIDVTDTGETTLTGIELRNAEGGLMDVLPPIPVGGTRSFVTTANIFETTDVSYVVICADDYGNSDSQETNSVHITVRAPSESETPEPTETQTPTAAPTVTETPLPSPTTQSTVSPDEEKKAAAAPEPIENLALYIIIGVLGLFIMAGAAVITFLVVRNKKKGGGKRGDTL